MPQHGPPGNPHNSPFTAETGIPTDRFGYKTNEFGRGFDDFLASLIGSPQSPQGPDDPESVDVAGPPIDPRQMGLRPGTTPPVLGVNTGRVAPAADSDTSAIMDLLGNNSSPIAAGGGGPMEPRPPRQVPVPTPEVTTDAQPAATAAVEPPETAVAAVESVPPVVTPDALVNAGVDAQPSNVASEDINIPEHTGIQKSLYDLQNPDGTPSAGELIRQFGGGLKREIYNPLLNAITSIGGGSADASLPKPTPEPVPSPTLDRPPVAAPMTIPPPPPQAPRQDVVINEANRILEDNPQLLEMQGDELAFALQDLGIDRDVLLYIHELVTDQFQSSNVGITDVKPPSNLDAIDYGV